MNVLVNFSGKNFEESRLRLNASATRFGIDKILSHDEHYIKHSSFYQAHKNILDATVGAGYWLWKPFLILEALKNSQEGDIIIYSDAGIEIIGDLSPLIHICKEKEVVLFRNAYLRNKLLTKRDCYVLMDCDNKNYWNGPHLDASFCIFKNGGLSRKFVSEWLAFCCDERILTDRPNVMGRKNFFGFRFHRHDQSVLSLLAIRYGFELFRQPSQYGNHYKANPFRVKGESNCISQFKTRQIDYYSSRPMENSPYFQLLDHHRSKAETRVVENLNLIQKVLKSAGRKKSKIMKLIRRQ